jgi:HD-GYP domain-containing protein (c-di-GMP phosphodiesterase class II)
MLADGRYRRPAAGPADEKSRIRLSREADMLRHPPKKGQPIDKFFPGKKLVQYRDKTIWRNEKDKAKRAVDYLYGHIVQIMDQSLKSDHLDLQNVSKAVSPMVHSVIRNPDPCLWWATTRPATNYHHDSALRTSVFAAVLGRRLGLPVPDLVSMAIGGMLFDIGKSRLENTILKGVSKFNDEEIALIRRHVEIGLKILDRSGIEDPQIIEYVAHHHERFDGSGYPQQLADDMIPAFGRIAGLVDCYSAMTSSRGYARIKSPAEAINQLYKLKDVHFHTDLIEEFIQTIGVYPVGALVEMTSDEVAVVVAQSRTRRLRPVILLLLDADKQPTSEPRYVELDKVAQLEDGSKYDIVRNLEPNAHGIDLPSIELI